MATNSFSDVNTLSFIVALIDLTQNISTSIRNLINTIPHELLINITTICILTVIFVPLFIFLTRGHSPCKIGNLKIPIWTIASSICLLINSLLLLFWASWHLDSMDKKKKGSHLKGWEPFHFYFLLLQFFRNSIAFLQIYWYNNRTNLLRFVALSPTKNTSSAGGSEKQ